MSARIQVVLALLTVVALLGSTPAAASEPARSDAARYIVSLSASAIASGVTAGEVVERNDLQLEQAYPALQALSLGLTPTEYGQLLADPAVGSIVPDVPGYLASGSSSTGPGADNTTTINHNGVSRIGADTVSLPDGAGSLSDIDVAVLDTGINSKQPALNVAGGYNCVGGDTANYGDTVGHGTHVAGIIAGRDLGNGVHGVAPGARLWSVRIFNSQGRTDLSSLLCGLNWVAEHAQTIDVVNFSAIFGDVNSGSCGVTSTGTIFDPFHHAVCHLVDDLGIPFVAAAGNFGSMGSNYLPAAFSQVISVGAIADTDGLAGGLGPRSKWGQDDTRAAFSNYGPTVTLFAPGVSIVSTGLYSGDLSMSGTSMATPFVTGAVALYQLVHPDATPSQIRNALVVSGDSGAWAQPPLLDVPNLLATDPSVVPEEKPAADPFAIGPDGLPVR